MNGIKLPARRLVYIIGPPGAGKTTFLRAVCARLGVPINREPNRWRLMRYAGLPGGVWVLGDYTPGRGEFGGTDGLSMAVMPDAKAFLAAAWRGGAGPRHLLGEGDRLAVEAFFLEAAAIGWEVHIVELNAGEQELKRRCAVRAAQAGVPVQDERWWRGRMTKIGNLRRRLRGNEKLAGWHINPAVEAVAELLESR